MLRESFPESDEQVLNVLSMCGQKEAESANLGGSKLEEIKTFLRERLNKIRNRYI